MSFAAAVRTCLRKYVRISGRAGRAEYWWFFLAIILASLIAGVLDGIAGWGSEDEVGGFGALVSLLTFVPSITVLVRRLHDTGKPGYFLFLPYVGLVAGAGLLYALPDQIGWVGGGLVVVVVAVGFLVQLWWLIKPSDPGPNRFGPHPLAPEDGYEEVFR